MSAAVGAVDLDPSVRGDDDGRARHRRCSAASSLSCAVRDVTLLEVMDGTLYTSVRLYDMEAVPSRGPAAARAVVLSAVTPVSTLKASRGPASVLDGTPLLLQAAPCFGEGAGLEFSVVC